MYTALSDFEIKSLKRGDHVAFRNGIGFVDAEFIGWMNRGTYSRALIKFNGRQGFCYMTAVYRKDGAPGTPQEKKEKIRKWISALSYKTVANGCLPGEAKLAAAKIKELQKQL